MLPIRDINPTSRATPVTWLIMIAAAAVFLFVQPHSDPGSAEFLYAHAAIPCELTTGDPITVEDAASGHCTDDPGTEISPGKSIYLSALTTIFLHGSLWHLLGNLWVLAIFGNNVEDAFGSLAYGAFYVLTGVVATVGHTLLYPGATVPVVGASGAIAGVLGAYFVLYPWKRVVAVILPVFFLPFRVPAALFLVVWLVLQFTLSGTDTNIAWEAHVIGFAIGVLVGSRVEPPVVDRRPAAA